MPREHRYYVYMMTSSSRRVLYTGITNDIYNRRNGYLASDDSTFVGRYRAFRLVYVEEFKYVRNAIAREKEIKGRTRAKKEALMRAVNPQCTYYINEQYSKSNAKRSLNISPYQNHHCLGKPVLPNRL